MVGDILEFDYYYGIEAEQFSFYRIPRLLIKDERFRGLSSDAKLLYGLMLDRLSLSMKNGWLDDDNRAYIIYALESIMEDLGCSRPTCTKIMRELETEQGIGLIERKRRGLGKPDIIYVKNFATLALENERNRSEKSTSTPCNSTEGKNLSFKKEKDFPSRKKETFPQEGKKLSLKKEKDFPSRSKKTFPQEGKDFAPNYINNNYIDNSYINQSNQSYEEQTDVNKKWVDEIDEEIQAYITIIKENIEYDYFKQNSSWQDKCLFEELFELICDVVCVSRKTIKIAGTDYPYMLVKSKFLKLNSSHIRYVLDSMHSTTKKINNIRAYMLTALYNAPNTIDHFYQQEMQHDMYAENMI